MAVSSTSSSSSRAGSTLDVAGIVSGLMEVENAPVNKLDSKISKSSVKITVLGQIKSQLSTLKSALVDLQTPANFSKQAAKFSNASVASADFTGTAVAGSYQMEVTTLAQPAIWNVSGFADAGAATTWYTLNAPAAVRASSTPTVFKSGSNNYVLSLTAPANTPLFGTSDDPPDTAITSGGVTGYSTLTFNREQEASDAVFKLNGVSFSRASNTVTDALTGITLNLTTKTPPLSPITLTVSNEQVSARPKLDALVKAYNDLYSLYKEQTASSIDVASRGILNSDFAVTSVMRQLMSGLMLPLTKIAGQAFDLGEQTDLSSMGLKLLDSGKLAVDDTLYAASSGTLQTRLSAGIRIGYNGTSDLSSQISDMLLSGGVLQDRIDSETTTQSDLNKRKTALQDKLIGVQARYTAQYASLDALLFKLQGTSDSLKSALDGLTNSQKNN
jgi:flagellar hook-associated protein 2